MFIYIIGILHYIDSFACLARRMYVTQTLFVVVVVVCGYANYCLWLRKLCLWLWLLFVVVVCGYANFVCDCLLFVVTQLA